LTNSITLALDDPTSTTPNATLNTLDYIFLLIYTVEMGFKVLAYGFFFAKNSYIKDPWNILDFVIVVTA
jgi:voltage-dependent calcium channel L type alpha-1S